MPRAVGEQLSQVGGLCTVQLAQLVLNTAYWSAHSTSVVPAHSGPFTPSHNGSTFADLGSGEKFGSALVHDGDLVTTVTLDSAALEDIAAAEGKEFAIGGSAMATMTPVPEASTWAMMIAGFGLMGGVALRRRLKTIALA